MKDKTPEINVILKFIRPTILESEEKCSQQII